MDIYLAVVVDQSELHPGELFLNGQDIGDESPLSGPLGMSSVTTLLSPGSHYRLSTTRQYQDLIHFAAYVYAFGDGQAFSYLPGLNGNQYTNTGP